MLGQPWVDLARDFCAWHDMACLNLLIIVVHHFGISKGMMLTLNKEICVSRSDHDYNHDEMITKADKVQVGRCVKWVIKGGRCADMTALSFLIAWYRIRRMDRLNAALRSHRVILYGVRLGGTEPALEEVRSARGRVVSLV